MTIQERERARVEAVKRYRILDSEREGVFDRITALAASMLKVPHAAVSLVDADRSWFKSIVGVDACEVPRSPGLCERSLAANGVFHLSDAKQDVQAQHHPMVSCDGGVRFYAGIGLVTPDKFPIGTLCVFSPEPRELSGDERIWLEKLAAFTMHEIESRRMRLELRHTEDALLQAQRLGSIGLVASGVAHDFNNLLSGIVGNVELLKAEVEPGSTASVLVNEIETVACRSAELVGQVLAFAGREDESSGPVELNALVEQTRYMLTSVVHENTDLEIDLTEDEVIIDANAASIRQLVMNLITNASESYLGEPGVVRLKTSRLGGQVSLTVADQGAGLEAEVLERMFDPLFTTKAAGLGLGMTVVKRILDAIDARLEVESEPGQGTTITVNIPSSSSLSEAVASSESSAGRVTGEGTILVIDDEQSILNVTSRILTRSDYKVICALGGLEGIDLLESHKDDVRAVLLDMSMPVLSGEETLAQLRSIDPELKVILSSGHTEEQARAKFAGHDIEGFLKKP